MTRHPATVIFGLLAALAVQASAARQQANDPDLVYVRAIVTTNDGRFVTGLRGEQFQIREDDKVQRLSSISSNNPFSVAIILDGSTGWRNRVRALASAAFNKVRTTTDDVLIAESPDLSPNEATWQALNQLLQVGHNRLQALVLFTDRGDPGAYSYSRVKDFLKDQDIQFYVVGASSSGNIDVLKSLADVSGGKAFFLTTQYSLERVSTELSRQMRYQYLLGYRPTNSLKDGKWRKVKVRAENADPMTKKITKLDVRSKPGYFAPTIATTAQK
jgi:Ca-activated chloride channel family protein